MSDLYMAFLWNGAGAGYLLITAGLLTNVFGLLYVFLRERLLAVVIMDSAMSHEFSDHVQEYFFLVTSTPPPSCYQDPC